MVNAYTIALYTIVFILFVIIAVVSIIYLRHRYYNKTITECDQATPKSNIDKSVFPENKIMLILNQIDHIVKDADTTLDFKQIIESFDKEISNVYCPKYNPCFFLKFAVMHRLYERQTNFYARPDIVKDDHHFPVTYIKCMDIKVNEKCRDFSHISHNAKETQCESWYMSILTGLTAGHNYILNNNYSEKSLEEVKKGDYKIYTNKNNKIKKPTTGKHKAVLRDFLESHVRSLLLIVQQKETNSRCVLMHNAVTIALYTVYSKYEEIYQECLPMNTKVTWIQNLNEKYNLTYNELTIIAFKAKDYIETDKNTPNRTKLRERQRQHDNYNSDGSDSEVMRVNMVT
jgi:hypothetical protein